MAKSDDAAGDVTQSTSDLSTVGRAVRPHRGSTKQAGTKPGKSRSDLGTWEPHKLQLNVPMDTFSLIRNMRVFLFVGLRPSNI